MGWDSFFLDYDLRGCRPDMAQTTCTCWVKQCCFIGFLAQSSATFPYSVWMLVGYLLIKRWRLGDSCCRCHKNYGLNTCVLLSRNTDLARYQFGKRAFWLRSNTQTALRTCRKERYETPPSIYLFYILWNVQKDTGKMKHVGGGLWSNLAPLWRWDFEKLHWCIFLEYII